MNPSPPIKFATTAIVASGALAVALIAGATVPNPPSSLAVTQWWDHHGTALAAMALVRAALLGGSVYTLAIVTLTVLAHVTHLRWVSLGVRALTLPVLRRQLLGTAVLAASLSPVAVSAQDTAVVVVTDVGASDQAPTASAITITDVGAARGDATHIAGPPAIVFSPSAPTAQQTVDAATKVATPETTAFDTWKVERGDHLWAIARETLRDNGVVADDAQVARYWRRLIETNRADLGTDPDVIQPGLILELPAVQVRPGR